MRSLLCISLVCLFATAAAAQFGKGGTARPVAKSAEKAEEKMAEKGRPEAGAKAADQARTDTDLVGALLAAMDSDSDGIVTKIEMNKALAALRKVPKDKKGNMEVPSGAAAAAATAGLPQQGGFGAQPDANGRGNEAMARFMSADTNRDGVITPNEVPPQQRNILQAADLNRDGIINADEYQAFIRKMGDRLPPRAAGTGPKAGGVPGDGGRKPPQQ